MFCIACHDELDIETAFIDYDANERGFMYFCARDASGDATPVAGSYANTTTLTRSARSALLYVIARDDDDDTRALIERALDQLPDDARLPLETGDADIDSDDPHVVVRVALSYYF